MKVAYIARDAEGVAGWGRYTAELVRALRPLGVEPVLVTAGPVDPLVADEVHEGLLPPLFYPRGSTLRALLRVGAVRRAIAGCDLVHCMAEPYMPLAALAAGKRPLAMMAYGTWSVRPLKRRSLGWLFRWAFGRADSTISISRYTLARTSELVNLRHAVVCTGGVHVEDFKREVSWQPPAWAKGAQIALGVGVLKRRKGYHVALEAIGQASQFLPNLHYVILGRLDESGYVRNLRQRITALGLEDRVHLLGQVDFETLVGWYRRADVMFQLPVNVGDSFEGLGLTYYEAGVSGTPSVATLDCGSAEAVLDSETGFLVPQNDPKAAADALVRLLSDEALHARLGEGARRWAEKQTWAQVAQTVMREYERLLAP